MVPAKPHRVEDRSLVEAVQRVPMRIEWTTPPDVPLAVACRRR
jgi:hypothetical protein